MMTQRPGGKDGETMSSNRILVLDGHPDGTSLCSALAKLKGLFDRLFLPGIAFAYEGDGHFPKKLFEGRTARVLITADTPPWYLWLGYRNGWLNVLRRQILDFVGLKVTRLKVVGPIRDATPARIEQFLATARALAA